MGKASKEKMILVSDMNGLVKSKWMLLYKDVLSKEFDIITLCSLELAEIDAEQTKEEIHHQFVNGGLEIASQKMAKLSIGRVNVVAFSIGGVIAWKAALAGLQLDSLYAVSSTRLRKEIAKPKGELKLVFGAEDTYAPEDAWYHKMEIIPRVLPNEHHDFYQKPDFIRKFSSQITWANGIIY